MANYVIIPYDDGLGWLMVSRYGLNSTIGDNVTFLRKMTYSGVTQKQCKKTNKGFKVLNTYKDKLIYKSPFEALKRLSQTMHSSMKKLNSNKFRVGSITVCIIHPSSRGTTWKFIKP